MFLFFRVSVWAFAIQCVYITTKTTDAFVVVVHRIEQHHQQRQGQKQLIANQWIDASPRQVTTPAFLRVLGTPKISRFVTSRAATRNGNSKEGGDEDVPPDWNEDDLLAEFEDLEAINEDVLDIEAEEEVLDVEDGETLAVFEEDEDEDDEVDLDEIDLDDEDEDFRMEGKQVSGSDWMLTSDDKDYKPAEWDETKDGGAYEIEDDPSDPNYMKQKELVEAAVKASEERERAENFDPLQFIMNEMTDEQATAIEGLPFLKQVEERARSMMLEESDLENVTDLDEEVDNIPDLMRDDPYPRHEPGETNFLESSTGLSDDDMEEFDRTYKKILDKINEEPWDKVMLKDTTGWDNISNKTYAEMDACLDELGGSSYNVTRWLLYDLDFNVSNLLLAAIKHNPEAPILLNHWYPQLLTYSRYEHVRQRNFDFTWDDVEKADTEELKRYYEGFGYNEIPNKAPAETGIISLEELDEEEIKMAAFENWMSEVYNEEWDRKDFDDDDMKDEDNVFSEFFEQPQHPDKPAFDDVEEDLADWHEDIGDDPEVRDYRDRMGQKFTYDIVRDEEFQREFRGHLVIACTAEDQDLAIAEKITSRFQKEFGKKVWVETRVESLAREEDNVFEVWLESYEIDLLHSKKRASSSANRDWKGSAVCDDAQIDYLVERVRFLISDDARYSYRFEFETVN